MNVYEALEVQKNPEYAEHLKKSQEFAYFSHFFLSFMFHGRQFTPTRAREK